jgi:hypothetical protein
VNEITLSPTRNISRELRKGLLLQICPNTVCARYCKFARCCLAELEFSLFLVNEVSRNRSDHADPEDINLKGAAGKGKFLRADQVVQGVGYISGLSWGGQYTVHFNLLGSGQDI